MQKTKYMLCFMVIYDTIYRTGKILRWKMILKDLLGDKKFWGSILGLAIPIAVQNLLQSSFVLVDTLMVGQLGDVSLAAVGMAGQWSWLLNMLTFGVCSGASIFLSQYFGEKNKRGMVHTYSVAIISGLLFSILFLLVGLFAPEAVIKVFNRDAAVVLEGVTYLKIAVFSYPGIMINMLINMVLRSTQRVKLPMYVSLFTTVLNAFLDYGLIFGAFGLPQLGVRGAALATVISSWMGPVIIFTIMAFKRDDIFFAPIKEMFGFDFGFVKRFYRNALPVILNETLWGLGTVVYNVIFSNMGYEYTAAVSILRTFENISLTVFVGLTNASCVCVGQNIGGGKIKEGIKNSKRFMVLVPLAGLIIGAFVVLFRTHLVEIFNMGNTISDKTLVAAKAIMIVYGIEVAVRNIPYVAIVGIFRSGGDTKNGMKYDLMCLWLISIPMTFIASVVLKLPFVAVFACSYLCEDYLKAILCIKHFNSNRWIKPVTDTGKAALKEYLGEV